MHFEQFLLGDDADAVACRKYRTLKFMERVSMLALGFGSKSASMCSMPFAAACELGSTRRSAPNPGVMSWLRDKGCRRATIA
jgi:hypothetical protein